MKKCSYCGTYSEDNAMRCRSCGANAFVKVCAECGTEYTGSACPNCSGTQHQSTQQQAQQSQQQQTQHVQQNAAPQQKAGCLSVGGRILLWIFFFPVMLTIAIFNSRMHTVLKVILSVALWGLLLVWANTGKGGTGTADGSTSLPAATSAGTAVTAAPQTTSGLYLAP